MRGVSPGYVISSPPPFFLFFNFKSQAPSCPGSAPPQAVWGAARRAGRRVGAAAPPFPAPEPRPCRGEGGGRAAAGAA